MPHLVRTTFKIVLALMAALITHGLIIYLVRPEAGHLQLHPTYTRAFGLGPWIGHLADPQYVDGERWLFPGDEPSITGAEIDHAVVHLFWLCLFAAAYLLLLFRPRKAI